jgi:glutaconyl-CoA/methylmalonyl-CoA decarboxylase subunit delta
MFFGSLQFDFSVIDNTALEVVLVGMLVVFSSLISIYAIVRYVLPAVLRFQLKKAAKVSGKKVEELRDSVPADMNAAIAMALYMYYNEIHDEESNVITINRVSRTYSPWSSKLYNMRGFNNF